MVPPTDLLSIVSLIKPCVLNWRYHLLIVLLNRTYWNTYQEVDPLISRGVSICPYKEQLAQPYGSNSWPSVNVTRLWVNKFYWTSSTHLLLHCRLYGCDLQLFNSSIFVIFQILMSVVTIRVLMEVGAKMVWTRSVVSALLDIPGIRVAQVIVSDGTKMSV